MKVVQILERKWIIRTFGIALILAPFVNLLLLFHSIKTQNHIQWSQIPIQQILASGELSKYLMIFMSLILGLVMLNGSKKVWKAVVVFLFVHIVMQIPHIGADIKQNWLWGPLFLFNVALFVFIADQLVFRQKNLIQKTSQINSALTFIKWVHKEQQIPIQFEKNEPWAQLKMISSEGILLKKRGFATPENVENSSVDFIFDPQTTLKAHFKFKKDNDYFFEFKSLNENHTQNLQNWLNQKLG